MCLGKGWGGGGGRGARRYLCVPGGLGGTCVSRGRMGGGGARRYLCVPGGGRSRRYVVCLRELEG